MSSNSAPQNRAIYFIMLALVVWGGLLALGAFLFDFDIRKFFVVTGAVGLFLIFWLLLIVTHRRESKAGEFDDAPYGGENAKSDHPKNPD